MKLPSVIVSVVLNERLRIHSTGISAYSTTTKPAIPHQTLVRGSPVVVGGHRQRLPLGSEPGAAAPNSLMNSRAIRATQMKISTLIADPMPRLKALNRLS